VGPLRLLSSIALWVAPLGLFACSTAPVEPEGGGDSASAAPVAAKIVDDALAGAAGEAAPAPGQELLLDELAHDARRAHRISFTPCADDPELRCGSLAVPIDYRRPRGASIELAVIKAPATGPRRKGAIFVNPGGPGGSGVDLVILAKPLFAALRQSFDIVSFDPRGTNRSAPVACQIQLPPPPADGSLEALAAFLDEASRLLAIACAEQNGELALHTSTNETARDMDRFRAALGEDELNYLGFSYGTILGSSYATLFPHKVRAMVLDAGVTPQWFDDYLFELDADGAAGAELALRRLDQLCRADAACPLQASSVVAVLDRVAARLDRTPVQTEEGIIDGSVVRGQIFGALYSERFGWALIPAALALADAGDLRAFQPRPPLGDQFSADGGLAVICNDSRTRRGGLDYLPGQEGLAQLYPRFGGVNFGLAITACTRWPATPVVGVANARTRHSIVVLANDYDPATPMQWSRALAGALHTPATLVRYRGGGHTIYGSGSACVDTAVEAYFRDPSEPPQHLTCPALPISFAAGAAARGAQNNGAPTMADVLSTVTPEPARMPMRR
jgi:pimeloyl-ACP methyl ester carboxylesterase